jgi:hypothetical protein
MAEFSKNHHLATQTKNTGIVRREFPTVVWTSIRAWKMTAYGLF